MTRRYADPTARVESLDRLVWLPSARQAAPLAYAKEEPAPSLIDPKSRVKSGPAHPAPRKDSSDDLTAKFAGTDALARARAYDGNKALEYDPVAAVAPPAGAAAVPHDPVVGSSTAQETHGSEKVGSGSLVIGENKTIAPLDRVRVDSSKRMLTTNQGVPVADNSIR